MRRCMVLAGLAISLLLIPVTAGCELLDLDFTMDVDYHTTIKTSGDVIQDIRLEITGVAGDLLEEGGFSEEDFLGDEGWDYDVEITDDSAVITATGSYALDEDGNISQVEGGPEAHEGFSVRVENGFLSRNYSVELSGTQGELGELGELGEGGEFAEEAAMLLGDILSFSWTITLPGKIVESNADTIEGSSATWEFDFDLLASPSGFSLTVQSQYTNWPVIGGIIAGAVAVLALAVLLFVRRKRKPVSDPSEIIY